jgi:hypothetical protein
MWIVMATGWSIVSMSVRLMPQSSHLVSVAVVYPTRTPMATQSQIAMMIALELTKLLLVHVQALKMMTMPMARKTASMNASSMP